MCVYGKKSLRIPAGFQQGKCAQDDAVSGTVDKKWLSTDMTVEGFINC